MSKVSGKKVMIGTPMYGGQCYSGFLDSMLTLQHRFISEGIEFNFVNVINESLITRARNHIAGAFMESDCDFLLFIDSDHRFDVDTIIRMIEEDDDMICGIAPKKNINWKTVKDAALLGASLDSLKFLTGDFVLHFLDENTDVSKKFKIKHGGTGLMLIKRNVFESLKELVPQYKCPISTNVKMISEFFTTSIQNGELLSEDYEFCRLWRSIGGDIYAAPWVNITHIGPYEFLGNFASHIDLHNRISSINSKQQ
jgi:hypothetical protein